MLPSMSNHGYLISPLIISYVLTYLKQNVFWLNVCYNHHALKIIWILLVLTNNYAPGLLLNTDVWTTSKIYINMQVSVTTNKTSRIFYMILWYWLQRESQITVLIFLWHQHQSRNQVLGNHFVYSPTYWMLDQKQKNVVLWLKNLNAEPLKLVIACGPRKKTERAFKNQWADQT